MPVVYALRAKDSDQYFYVGCTTRGAKARLREHIYSAQTGGHKNPAFVAHIERIGPDNVVMDTLERYARPYPYAKLLEREDYWIKRIISEGHPIVNIIEANETILHTDSQSILEQALQSNPMDLLDRLV